MRVRLVSALTVGVCLMMGGVRGAAAQTTVAANYDFVLHELTETSFLGAHGDVAKYWGSIAAVGEVGANHFDQATVITLAPGVRYAFDMGANATIQPSVQTVLGLWHCSACETNEFFVQPGVIVDWARSDAIKIRFQFDVRRIFFDFGGETAERVSAGVVWTLK